ncbi:MAG: substrate-binding domain-containing protein, partial [Acidimicrobiales bacterium]|nr:substrate-binding domain-containing protein [Acidimicrobiales bacterium]
MKKHFRWLAVLLAIVLVAAACGDDDSSSDSADSSDSASTEEEAVEQTQGGDLTFHMITHSDDGPFWSVVKRGMEAACADVGVNCVWMPGNNDPGQMVSDIETAIGEGSNGIAASLPSPDQLIGPLQDAVAAGVPVYTLNSGLNDYTTIGATTHIGQSEDVAGQGAGLRFNDLGATKVLCAQQEQSNVGLTERCAGLEETFNGDVITQFVGL